MKENSKNQQQQPGNDSEQGNQPQEQNTSNNRAQDENPQRGDRWNNYQTRELSDEGAGEGNASVPKK